MDRQPIEAVTPGKAAKSLELRLTTIRTGVKREEVFLCSEVKIRLLLGNG